MKVSGLGFCSVRCAQAGENNSTWKGENAGYIAFHGRVYRLRGPARECVWGCESSRYEWANLTGDYQDPGDYAQMCSECHHRYDGSISKCQPMLCRSGRHDMSLRENYYSRIRQGKEVRQCRPCCMERARGKN